ncbi:MAG: folylpolyglutamate synthase/dihydrofolate synthase family protein [Candidatus Omnitrophota bacterium]
MNYPETIQYLESFINYEKIPVWSYKESLKLERIKGFLAIIDNPQESLKCIHIAGTKGKGSTCAFVTYILREAGFSVGLYTSPHLSDFRERIRILSLQSSAFSSQPAEVFEGMISEKGLTRQVEKLKPAIEGYNKKSSYGLLSFFEVYTALAFTYFKEQKTDFVVLETGLGGRLDATNAVNSLVCAITPISYEHTQKLGNTLAEIAGEKAGIIKNYRLSDISYRPVVISAPQEPEAAEVIRKRCQEQKVKLYEVGKDIIYRIGKSQDLSVKGILDEYGDLKVRILGEHQLINATVAIGVVEALSAHKIKVKVDAIRKGLYNTIWPGRCEVIAQKPLIILDGAQNVASARVLKKAIRNNFSATNRGGSASDGKYKRLILVLGVSKDKDIKGIVRELYDLADTVILTKANNPRAAEPRVLAEGFKGKETYLTESVLEAKKQAIKLAAEEDMILVCGSLFVVGEYREKVL